MRSLFTLILSVHVLFFIGCESAPTKVGDSPRIVKEQGVSEITPQEAWPGISAAYSQFIDVRTPEEYEAGHAYRARNIPLDELMNNLDKLEKNEPVYLICRSGRRSKEAADKLVEAGFPQAISITGGTVAWEEAGLPMANQER